MLYHTHVIPPLMLYGVPIKALKCTLRRVIATFITGPPTHTCSIGGRLVTVAGICRRLSSVGFCNTPWRACRRLHPRRPGDDTMSQINYSPMAARRASRVTSR